MISDRIVTVKDVRTEAILSRIVTEEMTVMTQEEIAVKEDSRPTAGITETLITEIVTVLRAIKIVTAIRVLISMVTGAVTVILAIRDAMEDRQINSEITNRIHSWIRR